MSFLNLKISFCNEKVNNSKIKKDDIEKIEDNNENESKLISDSYQNKTSILTRIKKHDPKDIPISSIIKDNSKLRKTDLGDIVTKKIKPSEKKKEPIVQKLQKEQNIEEKIQENVNDL